MYDTPVTPRVIVSWFLCFVFCALYFVLWVCFFRLPYFVFTGYIAWIAAGVGVRNVHRCIPSVCIDHALWVRLMYIYFSEGWPTPLPLPCDPPRLLLLRYGCRAASRDKEEVPAISRCANFYFKENYDWPPFRFATGWRYLWETWLIALQVSYWWNFVQMINLLGRAGFQLVDAFLGETWLVAVQVSSGSTFVYREKISLAVMQVSNWSILF